jgi:hypothetical protein
MYLLDHYSPGRDPLTHRVSLLDPELRLAVSWWTDPDHLLPGRSLTQSCLPRLVVSTDASLHGWGAYCPQVGLQLQGVWFPQESLYHINVLELLAVPLALSGMVLTIRDSSVFVQTDNTTVVAYINHDGGTRSPTLNRFTRALMWCLVIRVSIQAVHIPGADTVVPDRLSRPLHGPLAPVRDSCFCQWNGP